MGLMKVKGATERTKQLRRGSTQIVVGVGEPMCSFCDRSSTPSQYTTVWTGEH